MAPTDCKVKTPMTCAWRFGRSYLSSAQAALNANNHTSAKSYLASFVSLVTAQSGVTINAAYATRLISWANDLIARL